MKFTTLSRNWRMWALGVTQAAVSRYIAGLEEDFGRQLLGRGQRTLEPTPACQILASTLAESFYNIADAVDTMRANASDVVTIGSMIGFSHRSGSCGSSPSFGKSIRRSRSEPSPKTPNSSWTRETSTS